MRVARLSGKEIALVSRRSSHKSEPKPWKLLLWTAVAGLIFGLIAGGEFFEGVLRTSRNNLHQHPASGQIVVIKVDDQALHQYGNWPWPRRYQARLVDRLSAAHVDRIFYDINFSFASDKANDQAFAEAIQRFGKVTLLARSKIGPSEGKSVNSRPLPEFAKHAKLGSASVEYDWENAVWRLPYAADFGHETVPSFAAALANVQGDAGTQFRLDYSVDLNSIPAYSAGDVLSGRVGADKLAGKDVLIGVASDVLGDKYFVPGYGRGYGVYIHAVGAETLKQGRPVDLGWLSALMVCLAAAALSLTRKRAFERYAILGSSAALLLALPHVLEPQLIFIDIMPGLFVLTDSCGRARLAQVPRPRPGQSGVEPAQPQCAPRQPRWAQACADRRASAQL